MKPLLMSLLWCACWSTSMAEATEPLRVEAPFRLEELAFVKLPGTATVTGESGIQLGDGTFKDCAGFNVELLPVTPYSRERIFKTYGNADRGQILLEQNPPRFTPDVREYHEWLLKGSCDARGRFRFEKVPAGDYFVMVFIIWEEPSDGGPRKSGGAVMQRIHVEPGAQVSLVLDSREQLPQAGAR